MDQELQRDWFEMEQASGCPVKEAGGFDEYRRDAGGIVSRIAITV